jgi:multiple sugar transport system substrate-binding protein
MRLRTAAALAASLFAAACGPPPSTPLTVSGSAVGLEAELLQHQIQRFNQAHPQIPVSLRATPDAADQRHQLYVQWLNAHATDPDVLQLDVIWTAEFAAAGWIASLDQFTPSTGQFFPATLDANRWNGSLFALPWFVDVGLLYWRTDLMQQAPSTIHQMRELAQHAQTEQKVPFGIVWQGARYEGLVTVFLEYLGAFGGSILDDKGRVAVDTDASVQALTAMCNAIRVDRTAPSAVLGWQEEQTRFAFQNGEAAFMRNWPYARPLLDDPAQSGVAGRFAIAAMPAGEGGTATAALGGSALAINAFSDRKDDAWAFIAFLLEPEQMLERARIAGQYPPAPALYDTPELANALHTDPRALRAIIDRAVARPATPVYSELSSILQVSLHRALSGQQTPALALRDAARDMQNLLTRVHLQPAS